MISLTQSLVQGLPPALATISIGRGLLSAVSRTLPQVPLSRPWQFCRRPSLECPLLALPEEILEVLHLEVSEAA